MELIRHGSLVSAEVAWSSAAASAGAVGPSKCLVTWEVFGGGLMGNLLTESDNVQLSLWPDSKYKVQVTCKNKVSDEWRTFSRNAIWLLLKVDSREEMGDDDDDEWGSNQIQVDGIDQKLSIFVGK